MIAGMNSRISIDAERIVFVRKIARYLILFLLMQRITMPGLLQVPLSLMTSQVLILCWDIHLHNQREILSLIMLMMVLPIPHLLLLIFHHPHSLHLQIILNREIYLHRDIKLSLSANNSSNNVLMHFGNESAMGNWNMRNWINWICRSMP